MAYQYSSADVSVLADIAELAKRCGLRPSDACAWIDCDEDARGPDKAYRVSFSLKDRGDEEMGLFCGLLGMEKDVLLMPDIENLEELVSRALDRAPRARHR
jgi:hypothetical protein